MPKILAKEVLLDMVFRVEEETFRYKFMVAADIWGPEQQLAKHYRHKMVVKAEKTCQEMVDYTVKAAKETGAEVIFCGVKDNDTCATYLMKGVSIITNGIKWFMFEDLLKGHWEYQVETDQQRKVTKVY